MQWGHSLTQNLQHLGADVVFWFLSSIAVHEELLRY